MTVVHKTCFADVECMAAPDDKEREGYGRISSSSTVSAMTPPGGNKSSPVDDRLLTADRSHSRTQ